jgi:hypothetical protein
VTWSQKKLTKILTILAVLKKASTRYSNCYIYKWDWLYTNAKEKIWKVKNEKLCLQLRNMRLQWGQKQLPTFLTET